MQENKVAEVSDPQKEQEKKYKDVLCYCDKAAGSGYGSLKDSIQKICPGVNIELINISLNSRLFLEKSGLKSRNAFLLIKEVQSSEQMNELFGLWKKLKKKGIVSIFIISDLRKEPVKLSHYRSEWELADARLNLMGADSKNKLLLLKDLKNHQEKFISSIRELVAP